MKLADTPETLAALSKEYEKHNVAKESETVDESVLMGYDRIMRLNKLELVGLGRKLNKLTEFY